MPAHVESLYLSSLLRAGDHKHPLAHHITSDLFLLHDDEWNWIARYIDAHRKLPTKNAFKAQFPGFKVYAVDDLDYYTGQLRKERYRHNVVDMLSSAAEMVGDDDLDGAVSHVNSGISRIQRSMSHHNEIDVFDDYDGIFAEVSDRAARTASRGQSGIPIGFPTLDLATGGPQPGQYAVVAARLGAGKSWVLVRMAATAVINGYRVQFDALEQSKGQISVRVHSMLAHIKLVSGIDSQGLMLGRNVDLDAYRAFLSRLKQDMKGKLFVSDASRGSVGSVQVAGQIERNGPDIVFIDYLSLMARPKSKDNDVFQGVSALSAEVKALCERYAVPIVCASQVNRMGTGKEPPGAEHLSLSDSVGQDADAVITLSRITDSVRKVKLVKYRHGRDGQSFFIRFKPSRGDIEEISGDEAERLREEDALQDEADLLAPPPAPPTLTIKRSTEVVRKATKPVKQVSKSTKRVVRRPKES